LRADCPYHVVCPPGQDRLLPIANVTKVMKSALVGEPAKLSKGARELVQECTSEFIGFLVSEAGERALLGNSKVLASEHILAALDALGFDGYRDPVTHYMTTLREVTALRFVLGDSNMAALAVHTEGGSEDCKPRAKWVTARRQR
jgi:histone H3/H4